MRCPTPTKTVFRSRRAALAAGARAKAIFGGATQYAYKCPGCKRWHLTSKPQGQELPREVEVSAEGLCAFLREHGLGYEALARRAGIGVEVVRYAARRGLVPEKDLAALQGAMAAVLGERRAAS